MNREELHECISSSTGNEANICQISAFRNGITVYEDCWHGYNHEDAVNVNCPVCCRKINPRLTK